MIESTLDEVYLTISQYGERDCNKKNYNIFKVLEMTDREVLMCRVLADFLNPEGAHGKGAKYLSIFLEKIIHRDDYETICASAHVFKEYPIDADRRIDIVIEAEDVFIPIEGFLKSTNYRKNQGLTGMNIKPRQQKITILRASLHIPV